MHTTAVGNYPKIGNRRDEGQQTGAPVAFNPNATSITTATATEIATLPTNLRRAIALFDEGKLTAEQLAEVSSNVTAVVIKEQEEAGLDLVTDGHIRWADDQTYLANGIEGFTVSGLIRYFDSNTYYRQPVASGKLTRKGSILLKDYQYAVSVASKPVKVSCDGPYTLARLSQDEFYGGDIKAMALDLAAILNAEAKELLDAGCPLVQFDEPSILRNKGDWELFKEVMTRLTEGLDQAKLALYTYFGDATGLHGYFDLPFAIFGLDLTPTYGKANWGLINEFPQHKTLAAGIVDARNTKLESAEQVAELIARLPENINRETLYINPNSGLEFLPRERAQEKLANMVKGAKGVQ